MNTNELIKMKGELQITKKNEVTGAIEQITVPNLVVTVGKEFIAASMLKTTSNSPAAMTHMGIGTGTTAAAAGDTALGTAAGARQTVSGSVTGAVVTYTSNFGAGVGTGAITEAGIFNASTGGTMLCRTVFSAVNKGANDSIAITWNVTVS